MNTLQSEWDIFAKAFIRPNAPEGQVNQLRTAFYAGAESMFYLCSVVGEQCDYDAAMAMLDGLRAECFGGCDETEV